MATFIGVGTLVAFGPETTIGTEAARTVAARC